MSVTSKWLLVSYSYSEYNFVSDIITSELISFGSNCCNLRAIGLKFSQCRLLVSIFKTKIYLLLFYMDSKILRIQLSFGSNFGKLHTIGTNGVWCYFLVYIFKIKKTGSISLIGCRDIAKMVKISFGYFLHWVTRFAVIFWLNVRYEFFLLFQIWCKQVCVIQLQIF